MKILNFEGKYLILLFIVLCISIGSVSATEDLSDYSNNDGESSFNKLSSISIDSINNTNLKSSLNNDDIVSVSASNTKTVLSSSGLNMYYGAGSSVVGYLKTSSGKAISGKTVKITINGKTYSKTTDSNGKVSLKISLTPKVYSTKFSFAGGSGYAASSCVVNVTVKKLPTNIVASNLVMDYKSGGKVVITLKNKTDNPIANKAVQFTINGKTYNKTTNSKGQASLGISLAPNSYSCKISFAGDSINASSSKTITVTVNKLSTKIIASDLNVYDDEILTLTLKDSNNTVLANKAIQFTINNSSYNGITDSNGKVSFSIPYLKANTYSCKISFDGDNYYLASTSQVRVKIHEGLEINPEDIENLAMDIVDYIEKNHKLPENISISNEKISISQYLSLISLDILNINGEDIPILLENISLATSSENCKEGDLDKTNYIKLVKSVYSSCSWGSAPNYVSSSLGNIGFNSLVYTLSNILKSYSVYGVLPESIHIYPWSVVSNTKTSFITCDSILEQAVYIKNYVESKHTLPSTVSINSTNSLVKINIAQFLKLELDLLVQLPLNSIQSFVLKTYKTAPNPSESVSQCSFNMNSYFDFAVRIINFYENNGIAPNYVVTDKGNLCFESCVYLYSEILLSISKFQAFPSNINIVPWSVVKNKNNVFVDIEDIISMATTVRSNVLTKHALPSSLSYSKGKININQFLYLETCAIENINNNFYQSIILKTFSASPNPTEDIVRGKLLKSNYLNVATNIKNFLLNNGYVPNYATCSVGKMDSKNSIFLYSEILSYFKDNNKLPDYVLINPWSILSNKNTVIFTPDQIINASYYIRDYIETNHTIPTTITVGAKSLNQNQILKLELATLHLINGSYAGSLVLDKYSSKSITDSLSSGYLNQNEYLDIARLIEYDMFYNDMINESTSLGKIGITNGLYIYSQILISYDNTGKLPDAINVKPWNIISNKNTKFVNIDEVSNVSKYIKNYIISNNSLPEYITLNGNKVDMVNLAYILATSFKMIDSNLYANIPLINFKYSDIAEENLTHYIINSDSYLTIANNLINYMDKNNALPSYLNTEFGKIRYESIILLFSTIFDYLNDNGEFLESTTIIPWNIVKSSKFVNIDEIANASKYLKDYIEKYHQLPSYISINASNISIISYAQLASEAILNINGDLYSLLIAKNFNEDLSDLNNENNGLESNDLENNLELNTLQIYSVEYIYLINQLNEYFNNNPQYKNTSSFNYDFNNAYIDLNNIYLDFNTMVYLISEVLSSYNHYNTLPNFLNFMSFNQIKDNSTILFSQEDIINSSYYLKEYIYSNHSLPNNWIIANHTLNIVQVLDLYTSCIYNIDFNVYQSIPLREFNNSNLNNKSTTNSIPSYENIISGNLEYFEYISLIYDLKESFDEGKVVSNLSELSLGDNIGFNSLLLMESLILNNYSSLLDNSTNPNYNLSSIEEITIIPWVVISNPDKVYNYRTNKVYDSIQEAIDDEDTLDKDYIGVAKSNIFESITINKTIYLAPVTNYIVKFIRCDDNISNYGSVSKNNSNLAIIYLYSNSSIIEGFTFINSNKDSNSYNDYKEYDNYNAIEVIGSYNTISNCIFNDFDNGVIVRGLENYIGFNEFNLSSAIIYGNSTTFEANKINVDDYGIKLLNSDDSNILGNIIHSEIPLYISNSSANINFNSIISVNYSINGTNKVYISSDKHIDLNNNWWGLNNPDSFNYFDDFKSKNVSCDSWLVLSLDSFVDYSTNSSGTHNTVLIGDLTQNNLNQDLSKEYVIDNLEMNFRTNYGTITDDLDNKKSIFDVNNFDNSSSTLVLSYDGVAIANIYASNPSEAYVSLSLDNEIINKMIYLPSNTNYGVINNRSNKSYASIQEAINDNDTKNGDIIILKRGIFSENIFIYKNITLKSEDITYLNSVDDSKATITIFANGATIDNLFISGTEDSYAVYNIGVNSHLINCTLSDSMAGLYTIGSNNCSLDSCNFLNNEYGIYAHSTDNLKCFNCSFIDDSYGIYAIDNYNMSISNSKFEYCWISLDLVNMNNTIVENTVITESYLGLELVNSNICLIDNLFSNNIVACSICNSTFTSTMNSTINSTISLTFNSTFPTINNRFVNNTLGDFAIFDNVNIVLQNDMWSCGPASLATVLHKLGYTNFNQNDIINSTNVGKKGTNLLSLLNYLHDNTIKNFSDAACLKVNSSELQTLDIVLLNISGDLHYTVIWDINEEWVILADSTSGMLNISRSSFDDLFTSYTLVLDASNRTGIVLSPQEASNIYGTWTVESAWTWLNTPCFEIPGYADLDENWGLLGQGVKLAGWFLLGIEGNGSITPLDLALDGLSIVSGFGLAERCGLAGATIIEKIIEKPMVSRFISQELYSIGRKVFPTYKTILSVLSNPVKYSINQISTKVLESFEKNALIYFAKNYISNNFNTLASVLGITGSYDNLLNNTLLLASISKLGGKGSLKDVIYNSKCTISSSLINTDFALKSIYKATVSIGNKASNALKAIKKAVSSPVNLKTAIKSVAKNVKKKVKSSKIYQYTSKVLNKSKVGKTVKKVVKTAVKTVSKAIVNTSKRIVKGINYVVKKLKFW